MRFLSILITLAIIAYAMSMYLESDTMKSSDTDVAGSKPKEYIDQAKQAADLVNEHLKNSQDKLDNSN